MTVSNNGQVLKAMSRPVSFYQPEAAKWQSFADGRSHIVLCRECISGPGGGRQSECRFIKGPDGRFIKAGQLDWAADCQFHIVPRKETITSQAKLFLKGWQSAGRLARPASPNGRFIKANGRLLPMAALSRPMAVLSRLYKGGWIRSGPLKDRV
ncbi:MAG: hypothetical protein NXI25_26760 [bacterium]|nr:hypothetical protein [bacterium]